MKIYSFDINHPIKINEPISLCLGFFDGVHIGHAKLIEHARRYSYAIGVLSFESSPKNIDLKNEEITPLEFKKSLFEKMGVEYLLLLKVDERMLKTSPDDFIFKVLKIINPQILICGQDFTFGYQGKGTPDLLKKYFDVDIINIRFENNQKISSSSIKQMIKDGQIEHANKLLNRPYSINGVVKHGFGKGRHLGFNTINIEINDDYVMPKYGVYLCKVCVDYQEYYGLANVGVHPTINELDKPIVEVNIFDFDKEIYGFEVKCDFIKFIRSERKFSNIEELKNQVLSDIDEAKKQLKNKTLQIKI